jgi:hypothetical protein
VSGYCHQLSVCCIHFLLLVSILPRNLQQTRFIFSFLTLRLLLKDATDSQTGSLGRKEQAWYYTTILSKLSPFLISALANQFRALEEDEIMFLDSIRERQEEEERQRKEKDGEEVKNFRECAFFHMPTTYDSFLFLQGSRSSG